MVQLDPHQVDAVKALSNRKILRGDVGSGKSRIGIMWALRDCKGDVKINGRGDDIKPLEPRPIYIITTKKKRDDLEWVRELALFGMATDVLGPVPDEEIGKHQDTPGWLGRPIVIDTWNNIRKYEKVYGATFLFDEQRLVGSGAWVKAFYRISRRNRWVILTATPADDWKDLIPVFVANRFYNSKAEFLRAHAVYNTYAPYPKVDRWVGEERLDELKAKLLVEVDYATHTERHLVTIPTEYDHALFDTVLKDRWNPWLEKPIQDAGELFRLMRRVSNEDPSRISEILLLMKSCPRLIVFYNFDYELKILRTSLQKTNVTYAEWNGHKHTPVPQDESWVYLVQYTAGSEGWNCISTNTMAFYSLTFSWKAFFQAQGRTDRMNTPFADLYYYVLRNQSEIDQHVWRALMRKKSFNEKGYLKKIGWYEEEKEEDCEA